MQVSTSNLQDNEARRYVQFRYKLSSYTNIGRDVSYNAAVTNVKAQLQLSYPYFVTFHAADGSEITRASWERDLAALPLDEIEVVIWRTDDAATRFGTGSPSSRVLYGLMEPAQTIGPVVAANGLARRRTVHGGGPDTGATSGSPAPEESLTSFFARLNDQDYLGTSLQRPVMTARNAESPASSSPARTTSGSEPSPVEVVTPASATSLTSRTLLLAARDRLVASPQSTLEGPPPYTRYATDDAHRKVTFTVSVAPGESVTLSAKRSVRVLRTLESACNILQLQPGKCRLHYHGRTYGHGDMEGLTLSSLDVENGDQLSISWDDITVHSELWFKGLKASGSTTRVSVSLQPAWSFVDNMRPPAPIDRFGQLYRKESRIYWRVQPRVQDDKLFVEAFPEPVEYLSWEYQTKPLALPRSEGTPSPVRSLTSSSGSGDALPPPTLDPTSAPNLKQPRLILPHFQEYVVAFFLWLLIELSRIRFLTRRNRQYRTLRKGHEEEDPFEPLDASKTLNDANAVLLKSSEIEPFLRSHFSEMGVPGGIVDNYLSRRLPSMTQHRYILIRILSASLPVSLRISPEPGSTIQVFLVFSGVHSTDITKYPKATERAQERIQETAPSPSQERQGAGAFELSWVELHIDDI